MAELDEDFAAALESVKTLAEDPGNDVKLQMYALFKQATVGDQQGKKPGFTDFVGKAKWDAWGKLKGTSAEAAKQQYVDLVSTLS